MTSFQIAMSAWGFWIAVELLAFYWLLKNRRH